MRLSELPPCFAKEGNCLERTTACHSKCKRYLDWKRGREELKQKIRAMKKEEQDINKFEVDRQRKIKKAKGR